EFGAWNQVLLALAALAAIFSVVSGIVMWWQRRPRGRLAAPSLERAHVRRVTVWIWALAAGLSLALPVFGCSLLLIASLEAVRRRTHNRDASEVTDEETIERHTKNLNLVTTLSYGLNRDWSLSLRIPVVKRVPLHDLIDETTGLPTTPDLTCMQLCAEPTRKQTHPSRSCASNEQVQIGRAH